MSSLSPKKANSPIKSWLSDKYYIYANLFIRLIIKLITMALYIGLPSWAIGSPGTKYELSYQSASLSFSVRSGRLRSPSSVLLTSHFLARFSPFCSEFTFYITSHLRFIADKIGRNLHSSGLKRSIRILFRTKQKYMLKMLKTFFFA